MILILVGWVGLAAVILYLPPNLGPRWLFFCLLTAAVSGTFLPVVYFFNWRFPTRPPVDGGVVVREGIWFGVFASAIAWMQLGKMLNPMLALFLAVIFILIEGLLRLRERSRWKPNP